MFENPRRGRQARNFSTNVPKIVDLKSFSKQILALSAPGRWQWKRHIKSELIRAALNFFALIPSRSICQILPNFTGIK